METWNFHLLLNMTKEILRKAGFTIIFALALLSVTSMLDGNIITGFAFMLLGVGAVGLMDRFELL